MTLWSAEPRDPRPAADWRRALAFAVLFAAAVYLGRLTRMDGSLIALVWPASGIAVLWLATSWRRGRAMVVDLVLIELATAATYVLTGAPLPLALALGTVNVLQPVVACLILERCAGSGPWRLRTARDLGALVLAAAAAAAAGSVVGLFVNWLATDYWTPVAVGQWVLRNTVCIFLPVAAGVRLLDRDAGRPTVDTLARALELTALAVASAIGYGAVFGQAENYPLSFVLLPMSLWVGLRFSARLAAVHSLLAGTVAVGLTLQGLGPFADQPPTVRAALGQAFIGVIGLVAMLLALHREERHALVTQLREATEHAEAQATLLTSIVDSISDGVSAVNRDGDFILRNPASRMLMGVPRYLGDARVTPAAWQERFGLFHPDGTPIAEDDMPLVRALRGDAVTAMDMLIRNAAHPDGRIVSISTRPLDGATGRNGAVAVYHDVTDDRRRQSELASFAAVVAHDLLNPLTTIDGWADIVRETVAELPPGARAQALDGITRIERAGARMRSLIHDLLAYSTVRDGRADPVDVSLADVVHDVAAARLDAYRGGDRRRPSIRATDLPGVHADPVLLRQLVDNLVGNALKYTRDDTPADITVSAQPAEEPGWVRIEVADRGIGIPPGQHDAVFGDFHRAHPGSRYAGTGLGLAICRRIVGRHGGVITAIDNPGGGARFVLTLPAATAATSAPRGTGRPVTRLLAPA